LEWSHIRSSYEGLKKISAIGWQCLDGLGSKQARYLMLFRFQVCRVGSVHFYGLARAPQRQMNIQTRRLAELDFNRGVLNLSPAAIAVNL
jgi:hypothetical protein